MQTQGLILQQALAAATICKIIVDLVRQTTKCPSWILPILALVFGVISSLLITLSNIETLTSVLLAQSVIAGILAAGSAMGVTELQKRAL